MLCPPGILAPPGGSPGPRPSFLRIRAAVPPPDVSLVIPVRDEAGNISPLVAEIRMAFDAAGRSWEAFFIDDGSDDTSWEEIAAVASADPRVQGVRHDRGLGKSAALMNGFARCRAAAVAMLDGDGQDDPAEIPRMLRLLEDDPRLGLVNGWKTPRYDPWHKTLPSRVFNWLVGCTTGLWLHDHNCGLKLMRGDVARGLTLDTDMHRFIPVLVQRSRHLVAEMPVHHRPRTRGVSKYGMARFFQGLVGLWRIGAAAPAAVGGARETRGRLRHGVYALLTLLTAAALLGRIGAVSSVDKTALEKRLVADAIAKAAAAGLEVDADAIRLRVEEGKRLMRPFLSANDRSRWLTIRSLVERGTFAIDDVVTEPGWDTIDAVAHPDASGRLRLYSSKPPLLAVLCAGPYWLANRLTGWTLGDHPFEVGRLLMVLFGLVPLVATIHWTTRLVEAAGRSDWGRIYAVALIACGTMLTTFAIVLTNHLPAAACTAASGWFVWRIRNDGLRSWRAFAAAGLTAGLAAAFELPALAWFVAVVLLLARSDLRRTLVGTLPAAAVVAMAAVGTTWLAHGTLAPPYAHRGGGTAVTIPPPSDTPEAAAESWNPDNWYDFRIRLADGRMLESYWRNPAGVDRGEPSRAAYIFHVLVGHHGIFSLTPAWLLAVAGLASLARRQPGFRREFAIAIIGVSVAVITFYLTRPQADRNYGGMTSGFRWAFWLAPLWTFAALQAADRMAATRTGRAVALLLLALSVVSVASPTWNPWTAPWLERWLSHVGWSGP
jgi:glycosyltransferase involved in cell wall biosynthesis